MDGGRERGLSDLLLLLFLFFFLSRSLSYLAFILEALGTPSGLILSVHRM